MKWGRCSGSDHIHGKCSEGKLIGVLSVAVITVIIKTEMANEVR